MGGGVLWAFGKVGRALRDLRSRGCGQGFGPALGCIGLQV